MTVFVFFFPAARKPKFNQKSVNVVLLAEGKGVITCWSNAIPLANNTWTKDGEEIILSKNAKYSIRGKQDLIINKVTKEDEGIYECTAINVFGKDKQTTNVTIGELAMCLVLRWSRDLWEPGVKNYVLV